MISRNILRSVGRKEIWSWALFWFALPFYFLLSFFFDVVLDKSWRIEWLLIAVATFGVATLLGFAAKFLIINKFFGTRSAGLINFLLVAVIGGTKNVLVGGLSLFFGLVDSVDWAFRIYGGAGLAIGILISFVYILGTRIDHKATMVELEAARANLMSHRAQAGRLLAEEQSLLLAKTQTLLLPRLDKIQRYLSSNPAPSKAVHQLREIIQKQVRPLSESLNKAANRLIVQPELPAPRRNRYRLLQDRIPLKSMINPSSMSVLLMLGAWSISYIILGFSAANWSLLFSLGSLTVIFIAKSLIPVSFRTKPGAGVWMLSLIGFIATNPLYWPLKEFSQNFEQDMLLLLLFLNVIGCVVGFAYSRSFQLDGLEMVNQMSRDNEALSREIALFEQQMWIARRNWSFVVHGTVQGALTAAITRLSGSENPEQYQIDLALEDLARATKALSKTPETDIDLTPAFQDLITTWSGICTVKFNVTDRATRALARDPNARMCLNEICKEAVSNSVRHGEAKQVTVQVDRSEDDLLIIEISNNGRAIDPLFTPGVGSAMLEEITLSWSISNQPATANVLLKASLPVSGMPAPSFSTSR